MIGSLVAQIGGAVPSTPAELITNATTVTQVVLGVLAFLSLLSWAIMFGAWREMRKAMRAAESFRREFERTSRLDEASNLAKHAAPTALPRLFLRGVRFVADTQVINQQVREVGTDEGAATVTATLTGSQIEALHLVLETEAATERDRLARYLPWLASIGSVSPLIGLLGTVLGVIHSFIGIATRGSGNLSAVAPGVAEALVATAAALAVAIPATFGYNIFATRLNRLDAMMESFATAIIALLVREGHI
jgi:biopolymer transport protein TolQ